MLQIFNQIHSGILVVLLVFFKMGMILAAVVLLSKSNSNIFVNLILYQFVLYAIIFILIIFGNCGNVHQSSCETLTTMRRKLEYFDESSGVEKRRRMRVVKSLPVVKIKFGSTNFIEVTTPFVYLQFVLQRIVDCMLVSN